MDYILYKRFKQEAIGGKVNLPAMTKCSEDNGFIWYNGIPLCATTSENAHRYFAYNKDGLGMLRGRLTNDIQRKLEKKDDNYQSRWDKVWNDPICQQFKRTEFSDYWLWNHNFYIADIKTLSHIAELVGA